MDIVIPIGFPNTYPLDSDLFDGWRYPAFEQLGPGFRTNVGIVYIASYFWDDRDDYPTIRPAYVETLVLSNCTTGALGRLNRLSKF